MKGQILKIHSDFYYVKFKDLMEIFECKIREVLKKQKEKVLVGDFVECNKIDFNKMTAVIEKICPRENFLTRPSVANIEQIVIISSIKEPDLDFEQLNRYICSAKYHNIDTKLCFNKNDLSEDDSMIEKIFEIYEHLGFEIIFTSALEKLGLEDFESILENKTTVFCGNSGVGKSSLINSICPDSNIKTKKVSEKTNRGTHTTRHCEIMEIKKTGRTIKIIDTPGFSNVKFDFLMPHEVDELFDEIKKYKSGCKFKNCLHIQEEDCNVLANIEKIDISRYQSYLSFVEEAKKFKEKIKIQGTKKETSQKQSSNKQITKISTKKRQSARNTLRQNIYKDMESSEIIL
jgi:ribosome biogenesis GTPase